MMSNSCKEWLSKNKLYNEANHNLSYVRRLAMNTPKGYSDLEWVLKVLTSYMRKYQNEANTICFNAVRLAWFTLTHKSSYGVGLKQAMAHLTINNSYTDEGFKDTALKVVASTRN